MNLYLNATFRHKESNHEAKPCVVEKIIELPAKDFACYMEDLLKSQPFIAENAGLMKKDQNGVYHCLLVTGKGHDDGILIESEGYDYARYSAFIPGARQIVNTQTRCQCVKDLEKKLSDAADEVISCANAYDGEGSYRALIFDLTQMHGFDDAYIPLLVEMLNERSDGIVFEDMVDEIMAYRDQQEEKLRGPSPLPFQPERMERLLDKALDWIGNQESGGELYNTLVERLGMSDDEIAAAGFDSLSEYFYDPAEEADMKLE